MPDACCFTAFTAFTALLAASEKAFVENYGFNVDS